MKVLLAKQQNPDSLYIDSAESEYVVKDLAEHEEAPNTSEADLLESNDLFVRADSIFDPTVLAEEKQKDLYLKKYDSSGSNSGRISISKPALIKMGSMLFEIERQQSASTEKEILGPHSMSLRQGRSIEPRTNEPYD